MENDDNFRIEKISINDLTLWDENARFPDKYFTQPEEDLIEFFLSKKDFKFKELAEAIVKDFDLPQLERLVVHEYDNKLVVLEGNRRVAIYKLLLNPNLAKIDNLIAYFNNLKLQISITEETQLECLITENKEAGLRYIDRKHANGNNEVGWGDTERAHYNKRRGKAKKDELFKIALTKVIKELDLPETIKEQVLGHGYVTTFYRIINSSPSWLVFGLRLNDSDELEYDDPSFLEKLRVVILNVLEQQDFSGNKINSRSLNKNEEIETYLKSIKDTDAGKVSSELEKNTNSNLFGQETINVAKSGSKKSNPKSSSRNYLIPQTCTLQINNTRINDIYHELKNDLLLDDTRKSVPNAVGVLFRVFLETTIDYSLEKIGVIPKDDVKLAGKVTIIADYMENNGIATKSQLKNIRNVAIAKNTILSINNFHDYVHSFETEPTSSDLKAKWNNLQEFFELLLSYIYEKVSKKGSK